MAFRDSWHRALVYFGLAEERDPYDEEEPEPYEPEAELEDRYRERPERPAPVARAAAATTSTTSSPTTTPPAGARRPSCAPSRRPRGERERRRVHLVIPKSFNDAQQVADKFKDHDPGRPEPAGRRRPTSASA